MHPSLPRFLGDPRDFEGIRHRVHLFMLGASHERAPLAIRERLAFNGDDLTLGLQALSSIAHEGVILSTCNRTEIYALFDDPAGRQHLRALVCATRDLPPDLLDGATEEREGRDAIHHLLRVASGLDSVVLGEPQILTQVQFALGAARGAQIAGPILTRLCHEALRTGKLARTRTGIARNRLSIAHAGIDLAARWLDGLAGRRVVVVGAGEIGGLTARILRNSSVADLVITNRTLTRAEALARNTGGRAVPLDNLRAEIASADAVFAGAAAPRYLIDLAMVGERAQPLIAVDLSVPRAIDPDTASHPLVRLFTVDNLQDVTAAQREKYEHEVRQAETLVAAATDAFSDWWRTREVVPTIAALRERAETIRESELERALRRLRHLSERDRNQIEALSVAIVNKLLHDPITTLKADTRHGTHEDAAEVVRRLFRVGTDLTPNNSKEDRMSTTTTPMLPRSQAAIEAAREVIPGGVNSPARAFRGVGGQPVFFESGSGSRVRDIDGNEYLDYVQSWGPLVLGHTHPEVVAAITAQAQRGSTFGAPTLAETELATLLTEIVPGAEMARLVSSGTEATMTALRVARAATGRNRIVKFSGCYHGHADMLLVQAGSGVATLGLPDSPGVPPGATADTLVASYNNLTSVEALFDRFPDEIAAIIVEPVAGNMGLVLPEPGFLEGLRDLTTRHGALLIFDEVLSGFRVHPSGAAAKYGITPDLVTLGKVVGGGLPLAAYAGRRDVMSVVAPAGPMYQAGTLSGNPLAVAAGLATLRILRQPGVFEGIEAKTARLIAGIAAAAKSAGIPVQTTHAGTLACVFFNDQPVKDWDSAASSDTERFAAYFHGLLSRGIYVAPSQYEAIFVSAAHTDADIDQTIAAVGEAMRGLA